MSEKLPAVSAHSKGVPQNGQLVSDKDNPFGGIHSPPHFSHFIQFFYSLFFTQKKIYQD